MKRIFEPIVSAWSGVLAHRLRSILTILGVVIGVAAVITLMSVGKGAEQSIVSQVQGLGSNLLFIRGGGIQMGGVSGAGGTSPLTQEDATAIADGVTGVVAVAPYYSTNSQAIAGSENMRASVVGITADYQTVFDLQTSEGDYFSEFQLESGSRMAVIGANVSTILFPLTDPVGQVIRIGGNTVRVIGVLEAKGESIMGSVDDSILVPMNAMMQTVAQQRTAQGDHIVNSIVVEIDDQNNATSVTNQITDLLRYRHGTATDASNDFSITSQQQLISTISSAISSMTLLLAAIAAISLLVGGIGVMNIMLVSVMERTREIGIRKALGAKEPDIWTQFLIEAAFLTLTGGVIGILLGSGAAFLVSRMGTIQTLVTPDIVLLAVGVSVCIGLFFGFYPAWNASRLDPVQALRSE